MSKVIFDLKDTYFSYLGKFPALCGIDMDIRGGQKVSIIGANGTGKSTLLEMLDGLIFPDKGVIQAFGRELTEDLFSDKEFSRYFRSKVGFVFQNSDVQLFCPTVKDDITFGPLQLGVSKEEARKRLDKIVDILSIKDLLERSGHQLSIGERRKVAIASVLVIEPDVLIFDEPTSGLDPLTSRHIVDIILEANAQGKTIITATHDLHIIEEISDIVYVLGRSRKISRSGNPFDILIDKEFLIANNLVHIHSHRHKDKSHTHPHLHLDHHATD